MARQDISAMDSQESVPPVEQDEKLIAARDFLAAKCGMYWQLSQKLSNDDYGEGETVAGVEHELFLYEQYDLPDAVKKVKKARRKAYERLGHPRPRR